MKKILLSLLIVTMAGATSLSVSNEMRRPQEPVAPYSYNEEEVSFKNSADGVKLEGTLTWPKGQGPFPAVVLLHGSAPFDRNESFFGHKPFLVLADHLTQKGIAVLRFDKRGAGKSEGVYSASNLEDFASDALAGVEFLKTRKEIQQGRIGLIGHSEGGMTAALAASKSGGIAFIVMMAAPCVNWEELLLEQERALQLVDGVPQEVVEEISAFRKQVFEVVKKEANREIAGNQLRELFSSRFNQWTAAQRKVAETYYGPKEGQIDFFNSVGFRYNLTYELAATLKKVKSPVLALNGDLDLAVSSQRNLPRIANVLKEAAHKDYKIVQLPTLNHGFQTCQTGSFLECANIEETLAPQAMNTISEWILEH